MKNKILLDLDGVVVQYDFPTLVKKYFRVELDPQSIFAYDLADVLGVSPAIINSMFKEQVFGPAHFIEGAKETLESWRNKHDIIIYTNRVKYMSFVALIEWLNISNIPFNGIDEKGTEDYDYHIDDSPAKLASSNSRVKILFAQPWNKRCLDISNQFIRVNTWEEIKQIVGG